MYKLSKSNLPALYKAIDEVYTLYMPIKSANRTNYGIWDETAETDIDTIVTVKPPKDVFFPQSETLYTCIRDGKRIEIEPEELQSEQFVVLGVRGCDVKGFEVLDRVFLSEPVDSFYKARRENGIIVSMACNEPDDTCFCKVFGIDNAEPAGDVVTWQTDDALYWQPVTEKGKALTDTVSELLDNAEDNAAEPVKENIRKINGMLPNMSLPLDMWHDTTEEELFNSPLWEELYKPCLACGTCTFVCPTCQCYDIKDYDTGHGVKRYRCWDSCMYSDFTLMAHGNNRTSQMQRFRQRFMHKLKYYPENNDGIFSCVGCGRCVRKCPSGLNIVKVIKIFGKGADI